MGGGGAAGHCTLSARAAAASAPARPDVSAWLLISTRSGAAAAGGSGAGGSGATGGGGATGCGAAAKNNGAESPAASCAAGAGGAASAGATVPWMVLLFAPSPAGTFAVGAEDAGARSTCALAATAVSREGCNMNMLSQPTSGPGRGSAIATAPLPGAPTQGWVPRAGEGVFGRSVKKSGTGRGSCNHQGTNAGGGA